MKDAFFSLARHETSNVHALIQPFTPHLDRLLLVLQVRWQLHPGSCLSCSQMALATLCTHCRPPAIRYHHHPRCSLWPERSW